MSYIIYVMEKNYIYFKVNIFFVVIYNVVGKFIGEV